MSNQTNQFTCSECEKQFDNRFLCIGDGEDENGEEEELCVTCYRQNYNINPEELNECDDCGDEFGERCDISKVIVGNMLYCNFCAPVCGDCGNAVSKKAIARGRLDDNNYYCGLCIANYEHSCGFCDDLWHSIAYPDGFGEYETVCPDCLSDFQRDHFECDKCGDAQPNGDRVINWEEEQFCALCFCENLYVDKSIEVAKIFCECGKECSLVPRGEIEFNPHTQIFRKIKCDTCLFITKLNEREIVCNGSRVPFLMSLKVGSVPTSIINSFLGGTLEAKMLGMFCYAFSLLPERKKLKTCFSRMVQLKPIYYYDLPKVQSLQVQVIYDERMAELFETVRKELKEELPELVMTPVEKELFMYRYNLQLLYKEPEPEPEAFCADCDEPMFDLANNKYWWSRGDNKYCSDCGQDVDFD